MIRPLSAFVAHQEPWRRRPHPVHHRRPSRCSCGPGADWRGVL